MTQPFQYIRLNGTLKLYATKGCADQLRKVHGISIEILQNEIVDGMIMVHARATTPDGRTDEDIAVVPMRKGMDGVNDRMKAITKAKRRLPLSICGLGLLDESELETIPSSAISRVDLPPAAQKALVVPAPDRVVEARASLQASVDAAFGTVNPDGSLNMPPEKRKEAERMLKRFDNAVGRFGECGITAKQLLDFSRVSDSSAIREKHIKALTRAFAKVKKGQYPKGLEPATAACDSPIPEAPVKGMAGVEPC